MAPAHRNFRLLAGTAAQVYHRGASRFAILLALGASCLSMTGHMAWAQTPPAAGGMPAPAQAPQPAAEPKLPFTRTQLPNGLDVLIHEDHTVPLVGVSVWYHVGSKDEQPGRTGFAHLFEHMMFQGSKHVGDDMHFKYISQAGGYLNGSTNEDRTNYYEVVPSNFLDRVLFLEADRMGFLLDTLTKDKLDNQRDVVRNERRQNYEMPPYGMAPKLLAEALYPPDHPYHHLTIGEHQDLEAATLDDVKDFFLRYYTPSNAALVIAGDVNPQEARRMVSKWFGSLPTRSQPQSVRDVPLPLITAEKHISATDNVTLQRVYVVWNTPGIYKKDDAELHLLAEVLGGKSGRLYRRLVYKDRLAQDVHVRQDSGLLASQFQIEASAKEGHTADELRRAIDEELAKLRKDPPTAKEMERVKNEHEAQFVYGLEEVGGRSGRTEVLQRYLAYTGDPDYLAQDMARFRAATAEGVRMALLTWLGLGRVVLEIVPGPRPAMGGAGVGANAKRGDK